MNISLLKYAKENDPNNVNIKATERNDTKAEKLFDFWSDGLWVSQPIDNPDFTINISTFSFFVERYALRLYYNDYYPIEWKVYGSMNGENWVLIDHRTDDICKNFITQRIDGVTVCGIYAVKMYEMKTPMKLKYIKVQQIGKNSGEKYQTFKETEWRKAFYLSSFEIFGRLSSPKTYFVKKKYWFFIICFRFLDLLFLDKYL